MSLKPTVLMIVLLALAVLAAGCYPNPSPAGLTPIPTLGVEPTVAAAVAAPGAAAATQPASAAQPAAAAAGNAQNGQTVYTTNCSPCHGADAGGGVGPALKSNKLVQAGGAPLLQTIENGRPGTAMPAWKGKLTDAQIADVIAYLQALQK
ncbi:MAG TPA: cytochrome c [Anaerolineae bacterium]